MSVLAVMTNCALVAISPPITKYMSSYGVLTTVLAFVFLEVGTHILIFLLKFCLKTVYFKVNVCLF